MSLPRRAASRMSLRIAHLGGPYRGAAGSARATEGTGGKVTAGVLLTASWERQGSRRPPLLHRGLMRFDRGNWEVVYCSLTEVHRSP